MVTTSRKPARGLGMALLLLVFGVMLAVSAFIGLMIVTAGTAVHPPLIQVAAPLLCDDDFVIQSQNYSYKPGQRGVSHQVYCVQPDGSREEVTLRAIFAAFFVYSAIVLALGLVLVVPLLWWLRRHAGRLQAQDYESRKADILSRL